MSEIKLQLNNGGWLKRNKILFFFQAFTHPEIKLEKNAEIARNTFSLAHPETEIKQNCQWSAETKQPTVGSFVLFQLYFTVCDGFRCVMGLTVTSFGDVFLCVLSAAVSTADVHPVRQSAGLGVVHC